MNLLVQGMEEKKNEEIAKLREIIENEIKEEQSKYLRKLVSSLYSSNQTKLSIV